MINLPTVRCDGDGPAAILYPGNKQTDVPLVFGREIQSMLPDQAKDAVAGFGITANFFPHRQVRQATARLIDPDGNPVEAWLSTPEKQLPGTGSYRQILLVPKRPLRPAAAYRVEMSAEVDGEPWREQWTFTTTDPQRFAESVQTAMLEQVNRVRTAAGLPVVTLDDTLSEGCRKHAAYVIKNLDAPSVQGLGIHDEDPKLPGYSKDGQRAGQNGVIAIISDPLDSVDNWMATLYHRIPLLDPRLKRIGYGQRQHPFRGWVTVLDAGTGK
ncbi:MAG: CAP domain-containing protein [Gemmataceae bacterium]